MWNFTQSGGHSTETVANRTEPLSSKYTVTTGQKSQTLSITNAQWSDVGVYKCIASINSTLIEAETSLNVLSEYTIIHLVCSAFYFQGTDTLRKKIVRISPHSTARFIYTSPSTIPILAA